MMKKEYVMGNAAIALGAIGAGVNVVCGYPGTPSSEIIETVAKHNQCAETVGLHLRFVEKRVPVKRGLEAFAERFFFYGFRA